MIPSTSVTKDDVSPSPSRVPRRLIGATIGLAVSLVALYLALRGVDSAAVARSLRATNPTPLTIAVAFAASSSLVRALRWRALFPESTAIPLRYYFTSMMIGYLCNNILPARAGDVIRAVVFGKRTGTGISTTAGTLVVERVVDACTLLAIVGVISFVVPLPTVLSGAARLASLVCLIALAVLMAIAFRGGVPTPDQAGHRNRVRDMVTRGSPARFSASIRRRPSRLAKRAVSPGGPGMDRNGLVDRVRHGFFCHARQRIAVTAAGRPVCSGRCESRLAHPRRPGLGRLVRALRDSCSIGVCSGEDAGSQRRHRASHSGLRHRDNDRSDLPVD